MTLALYGKSRKRQAGLAGVGLLAAVLAAVAALWAITSAFAHHAEYDASAQCDDSWHSTAKYVGGQETRLILIRNVKVNGVAYDPSWTSDVSFTALTGGEPTTTILGTTYTSLGGRWVAVPSGTTHYWAGQDNGFDVFDRSGASGYDDSGAAWAGQVRLYRVSDFFGTPTWQYRSGESISVDKPDDREFCLHLGKVTVNDPGQASFDVSITGPNAPGTQSISAGGLTHVEIDVAGSDHQHPQNGDSQDFAIAEVNLPPGWTQIGVKVIENHHSGAPATCDGIQQWDAPGTVNINDMDEGDEYTVCFRNEYQSREFTVTAEKVVCDTEADLPNWGTGANGAPGVIGATTASAYVAASNGACHLDPNWVFEINRVAGADHPRPDNNILHAADYTSFVGSTTIPATGQYRIREQKPAGYVDFSGTTSSPQDDVSAEFYCGDDVQNYDNLEWVGGANAYCVGFNARTTATLRIGKDDGTQRIAGSSFLIEHRDAAGAVTWKACVSDNNAIDPVATIAACSGATLLTDTNGNDGMIVVTGVPQGATTVTEVQGPANHQPDICQGVRNFNLNGTDWSLDADPAQGCQHNTRFRNEPSTATIHVDKVVCAGGTFPQAFLRPIATDTASNFASSVAACDLASGWEFEYKNDGNWHAFSNPTDGNGRTSEQVVVKQGQTVEIRETLQGAYNLAQLSCHNDTGGEIDNLDWIQNVSPGGEYYCIAINTPKEVKVNFVKAICPTYGDVPRNYTGGTAHPGLPVDQLGPASPADGSAVDLGDIPDACEVQPDNTWTFDLGSAINSSDLGQVQNGYVTLTGAQALQALTGKLWVSEVEQPNYLFASLKCYKDHVNQDNDDYIQLNNEIPKDVYCIAYNVPAKGKIWNVKVVTNDGADDTLFTADITGTENFPGRTFGQGNPDSVDALVGYYSSVEQDPSPEYTWMSTVAYDGSQLSWDDGEPICPVDYKVARDDLVVEVLGHELKPGGDLVFCHYNERLGQVFLTKYENIGGADTWDFDADELGDPSYAMPSNTTGITISHTESWWLSEGNYSVSELNPGGVCATGALTGDFETLVKVANAPIGANEVTDLGSSTNYSVTPGGKTYIAFGNRDCSEVLSAANIIVRKWQDVDADFSGESLLSGWTITITGTGGAAAGFGPVSQDTAAGVAAFLGVPDGTYTIQETPKVTHTVVGSDWRVGGLPNGSNTSGGATLAGVSVALDQTLNVDFFNQPKGKITVVKVETDNVGGGNFTWDFALDGCGIHKELSIVGSGSGSFQNLLPCANYLVTETNANSNGFFSTPIGGQGVNLGPGGEETVTFSNVRNPDSTPPPPTTTVTPPTSTPTHTPTVSTTPTDPTDTPVDPTDTPTPESTVAGEKTPGPGNLATPIAPDSGSGLAGSSTGASIMLLLMGLAAITIGSGFLALGRKRS
ncbi:MAG: hypothetical protein R3C29_14695 [Dehalococcoidia bacterium]